MKACGWEHLSCPSGFHTLPREKKQAFQNTETKKIDDEGDKI